VNNIESIIDKLKKKQITSDKEFFDLLRLHLCHYIKDRFKDQIQNQKDIAVDLHDTSLTIRLMIMGAETASNFIRSIILFDMTNLALELFSETTDMYKHYILRSGKYSYIQKTRENRSRSSELYFGYLLEELAS
jgi:hypothetical protein